MGTNGIRNMSIKLIIFDFDGTLGDTRRNIVTTMQMAIKEMQLPERTEAGADYIIDRMEELIDINQTKET